MRLVRGFSDQATRARRRGIVQTNTKQINRLSTNCRDRPARHAMDASLHCKHNDPVDDIEQINCRTNEELTRTESVHGLLACSLASLCCCCCCCWASWHIATSRRCRDAVGDCRRKHLPQNPLFAIFPYTYCIIRQSWFDPLSLQALPTIATHFSIAWTVSLPQSCILHA